MLLELIVQKNFWPAKRALAFHYLLESDYADKKTAITWLEELASFDKKSRLEFGHRLWAGIPQVIPKQEEKSLEYLKDLAGENFEDAHELYFSALAVVKEKQKIDEK